MNESKQLQTYAGQLLSTLEAAQIFGVDRHTLRNWVSVGVFEAIRLPRGIYRIPGEEIDRVLIEAGMRTGARDHMSEQTAMPQYSGQQLRPGEVAQILRVDYKTVNRWIEAGLLEASKVQGPGGRPSIYISGEEMDRVLARTTKSQIIKKNKGE